MCLEEGHSFGNKSPSKSVNTQSVELADMLVPVCLAASLRHKWKQSEESPRGREAVPEYHIRGLSTAAQVNPMATELYRR